MLNEGFLHGNYNPNNDSIKNKNGKLKKQLFSCGRGLKEELWSLIFKVAIKVIDYYLSHSLTALYFLYDSLTCMHVHRPTRTQLQCYILFFFLFAGLLFVLTITLNAKQ